MKNTSAKGSVQKSPVFLKAGKYFIYPQDEKPTHDFWIIPNKQKS